MQNNDNIDLDDKINTVKKILKGNRAKALGVATMFSLSSILVGCSAKGNQSYVTPNGYFGEKESTNTTSNSTNGSNYRGYHGGSYYYFRGASGALDGSWGKNNNTFKSVNAGTSTYTGKSSLKSSGANKSSYKSSSSGSSGKSGGISG